jgi:hypothetical protein
MISRQDIENEAAFVQRLIKLANPTGVKHTRTPWGAAETANDLSIIVDGNGHMLASFTRKPDRDLALYFVNVHAVIIGLLRHQAAAWEFAGKSTFDANLREFTFKQAEMLRNYADLFCRLGKQEEGA